MVTVTIYAGYLSAHFAAIWIIEWCALYLDFMEFAQNLDIQNGASHGIWCADISHCHRFANMVSVAAGGDIANGFTIFQNGLLAVTSHPPREFRFRPFRRVRKIVLPTKRLMKRPIRFLTLHRTKKTPRDTDCISSSDLVLASSRTRFVRTLETDLALESDTAPPRSLHSSSSFVLRPSSRGGRGGGGGGYVLVVAV